MDSSDITSLFTNIPLDETNDIIIQRLFNTSTRFCKLLNLAVKNCHFLFDGVAMGFPLGPLFADIFLCSHESTWLNNCSSDFKC